VFAIQVNLDFDKLKDSDKKGKKAKKDPAKAEAKKADTGQDDS